MTLWKDCIRLRFNTYGLCFLLSSTLLSASFHSIPLPSSNFIRYHARCDPDFGLAVRTLDASGYPLPRISDEGNIDMTSVFIPN